MDTTAYTFSYRPATIRHGPGVAADLGAELERNGLSRALVVTGSTVGSTRAVMDPVRAGLDDALVGVFDGVTPEKYLKTAYDAAERARAGDVDALVGLGGGSSLDVAKIASALAGHDRPLDDVVEEIMECETMVLPEEGDLIDVVAIPTTLPGADLSQVAGVTLSMDPDARPKSEAPSDGVSDARLMPTAVFHDPSLVVTTPEDVLASSAMNGYDKAIEMLYARERSPITDATAMRGLRLLQTNLPAIRDGASEAALGRVLQGIALAQYGVSTPEAYRASIIHAFGHAISRTYPIQQGLAHAVAAPRVLRYLFDEVDGRRALLAEALDVRGDATDDEAAARAVVDAVEATRDALELPSRLGEFEDTDRADVPELARAVLEDSFMAAAPPDLDPEQGEIEAVFEAMW